MARGNPLGSQYSSAVGYEKGFAFLPGTAIDQHFSQRNRFADLGGLIETYPQLLGIGIDESTALIVRQGIGSVVGANHVWFYDRRKEVASGEKRSTEYDRKLFQSVANNGRFDLINGKVLERGKVPVKEKPKGEDPGEKDAKPDNNNANDKVESEKGESKDSPDAPQN